MSAADLVEKRCGCPEAAWPKCFAHPWYHKKYRGGFDHNLTKWARVVLAADPDPIVRKLADDTTTKTGATAIARLARVRIDAQTYVSAKAYQPPVVAPPVPATPTDATTMHDAGEAFIAAEIDKHPTKAKRSKANDRAIVRCLTRWFGADRPVGEFTLAVVLDLRTTELDEAPNSTWAKYRTVLAQFFRWAARASVIPVDPIATAARDDLQKLKRLKANQRRRRISDDEWTHLLRAARDLRGLGGRLYALLVAAWETSARVGELLAIQWADVQLLPANPTGYRGTIWIRAQEVGAKKTGRGRSIEISAPLAAVLETLRLDPAGRPFGRGAYVFGNEVGERQQHSTRLFARCVLHAFGITPGYADGDWDAATRALLQSPALNLKFHDIRHESACRLLESGIWQLHEIQIRLGHTTLAQTATYLHAAVGVLRNKQTAYDAQRAAAVPVPAVPARNAPAPVPTGDKSGTNTRSRKLTRATLDALRLVKRPAV